MALHPAGERILRERDIATCLGTSSMLGGPTRGFCPFHQGSTGQDLVIEPDYGRFHCIVCGAAGWTESGWQRWRERIEEP